MQINLTYIRELYILVIELFQNLILGFAQMC